MIDIAAFVAEKNALFGKAFVLLFEVCYVDATLTTALGTNKDLTFTALQPLRNQTVRIRYVVAGTNTPLTVTTSVNDVTVNVATNVGGAATSTASQVMAALQASGAASALLSAVLAPSSNGSGVVSAFGFTALAGDLYFRAARVESSSVTWEGVAWQAFGIGNPTRSQNSRGQIPTFDVPLSNVGRVIESILEQNIVEGRPGRLITVHKDHLSDPTAKFEEPFTIVLASAAVDQAVITCASVRFNWLTAQIPRKVVTRSNYPGVMGSRSRYF